MKPTLYPLYMQRTFKLLKNSVELKKGAILREKCDDGDQDFETISREHIKAQEGRCYYNRKNVINNPEWFEEVFSLGDIFFTQKVVDKFKKFLKGK